MSIKTEVNNMSIKKTGKIAMLLAASAALVATLVNDKKQKETNSQKDN